MSTPASAFREPQQDTVTTPLQNMKILLVDDSAENLVALEAALSPLGENLITAPSGKEALRLCLEHDFSVILLDVRMPEMDGFEAAELIRARRRSSHTPILFLTAYRSDEQLFRGYDLGAVDFLFKPIVPEILQSKVAVFVELSRQATLLRQQTSVLAKAEQQLRSVLEAAPDPMVITRPDGEIVLANRNTDALFGYHREELIGENIRTLVPAWDCRYDSFSADEFFSPATPSLNMQLVGRNAEGATFPVEISASPLRTEDSVLITTAIRDITERVRAEESIRRINAELEQRVADRTAALTRSNEALRQFAWAASHDLQEPLRMVVSFSQWLGRSCDQKLNDKDKEMLDIVEQNAKRMERLLSGLRQYLQMSESAADPTHLVDCNEVLKTVLANLEVVMLESGAVVVSDPLPTFESIEVVLVQLLQNLIGNAIKYSREQPRIQISCRRLPSQYQFSVKDNGIGIDPKYLEYIFGVFKRLESNGYSGTGIGLAICKSAVERLGGRIWAESEPGQGSTFHFVLPVRDI